MTISNQSRQSYGARKSDVKSLPENVEKLTNHMISLQDQFNNASVHAPHIDFRREIIFAKNAINNSEYLTKMAIANPKSFETAFLQLASSGLTLDPSQKLAYLVPRDGRVILDVSYLGLIRMATDEGLCLDVVAEFVFAKDEKFVNNGRRISPTHEFDPFADKGDLILTHSDKGVVGKRGQLRGIYVDYLMKDNRHLVYFVTVADLASARAVSESWKKTEKRDYSPWTKFPWKMSLKSAIKQSIFQIPGNRTRISSVIEYLNVVAEEGFRPQSHMPVEAADIEMSQRYAAHTESQKQEKSSPKTVSGEAKTNVIEGEYEVNTEVNTTSSTNSASIPESGNDNEQVDKREIMSDIPGVRVWVLKRIQKTVSRAKVTLAYETLLATICEQFSFSLEEQNYAKKCLEAARREQLQEKMVQAIESYDFTGVEKHIESLGDCEFKHNAVNWLSSLKEEATQLNVLYDEACNSGDYSKLEQALCLVSFAPLKEFLTSLINQQNAA